MWPPIAPPRAPAFIDAAQPTMGGHEQCKSHNYRLEGLSYSAEVGAMDGCVNSYECPTWGSDPSHRVFQTYFFCVSVSHRTPFGLLWDELPTAADGWIEAGDCAKGPLCGVSPCDPAPSPMSAANSHHPHHGVCTSVISPASLLPDVWFVLQTDFPTTTTTITTTTTAPDPDMVKLHTRMTEVEKMIEDDLKSSLPSSFLNECRHYTLFLKECPTKEVCLLAEWMYVIMMCWPIDDVIICTDMAQSRCCSDLFSFFFFLFYSLGGYFWTTYRLVGDHVGDTSV
jgi:hypothetical protein